MIWLALAIVIAGILIANAVRSKQPTAIPEAGTLKLSSKAERISVLTEGIEELQPKIEKGLLAEIELHKRKKKNTEERLVKAGVKPVVGERYADLIKIYENSLDDYKKLVVLNSRLVEALRYDEDQLLKQQTDWFNLLEHYEYRQTISASADSYLEYGVDPPEISELEAAKAGEIRKRINARLRQYGLLPKNSPDPISVD